jgi:putative addiction module component (TIGR02574 family)
MTTGAWFGVLFVILVAMVRQTLLSDALALSPADRLELIDRLWASLDADVAALPLTDEQRRELDERLEQMDRDPSLGSSWEEVKARVWPRK